MLGIPRKTQFWHKWKALRRVPFRKSWFVGYDLEGNSYWEMIDHNNPHRLRRKVSLDRPYFHFSDFKPHPMWMQWLQFTRPTAPSLIDLVNDAKRLNRMKLLALQAEEKWKSVPLKSSTTPVHEDPRIGTAWGGSKPAESRVEPSAESTEDPAQTQQQQQHAKLQNVLKEMESRQKDSPKVVRDHMGQVKVEQKKKIHH